MPLDTFFTSAYKKPRVNHEHDAAWEAFKARPMHEQQADIDAILARRKAGEWSTPQEQSMLSRFMLTQRCRRNQANHFKLKQFNLTHFRRVVGGLNTNPK